MYLIFYGNEISHLTFQVAVPYFRGPEPVVIWPTDDLPPYGARSST